MKSALVAGLLALSLPMHAAVVAIYSFDSQNGTDSVGSNNATANGGVSYSTNTPFGSGYAFNVSNGARLTAADSSGSTFSSISNNLSVSFWVKAGTAGNDNWHRLIRKGAGGANSWIIGRYNSTADTNIRVDTGATTGDGYNQNLAYSSSGGTILTDDWHLVTYVLEYTSGTHGTVQEYVDGTLLSPNGGTSFLLGSGLGNSNSLEMGISSGNWTGLLDDVGIWSNPLTAAEARSIYTLGMNSTFGYGLDSVTQLHSLFALGAGGGTLGLDGYDWQYSDALSGSGHNPGDLYFSDTLNQWVLQMDATSGLTASPEPGRTLLIALSLALLTLRRRRPGHACMPAHAQMR